mgnify:CR=1 FL=1
MRSASVRRLASIDCSKTGGCRVVHYGGDTAAVEFTVRLDSGRTIAVVQPGSVDDYRVGDRVRVTNDGTTTRVAR